MRQHNYYLMAIALGIGLSLTPLRAQDPQKQTPQAEQGQAQVFAGALVDAGCKMNAPNDKCEVSENTRLFGLQTENGKGYRFDGEGNTKVMEALKSSDKKTGAIKVSINGTLSGATLKVDSIQITPGS
jgi:hypothetical protein